MGYKTIDRENIKPKPPNTWDVRREAQGYLRNRLIYEDIRRAYRSGDLTMQEASTLRGQVKAGDVDGAVKGLGRLLMRGLNDVRR